MQKLTLDQFENALKNVVFIFEQNYHAYSSTKEGKESLKFMAQSVCQMLHAKTERNPTLTMPVLQKVIGDIINKQ